MAKTTAQRQREYRRRHLKEEEGQMERLNVLITVHAKRQLERLAACYGVTQRAMLEQLLAEAERQVLNTLPATQHNDYYDKRLKQRVTQ